MDEIQIFDVDGSGWRFGQDPDGTPWAVASDVAKSFDQRDADRVTRLLDEDEKGTRIVGTPGGAQEMKVVFEDGIWELIFRSTKPEAKSIKKRVKAILREIRATGSYGAQPAVLRVPDITTAEGVLAMAEQFAATARQLVTAETKVRELEPKALAHDTYLAADAGDRLVRQVAKLIGWKERDLRVFLLEEKIIYRRQALCGANQYDVYAAHAKHFKPVEEIVRHTWGDCAHYTLYVRPTGIDLIQRRIDRHRQVVKGGA
jgi:anti-repressor protein